MKKFIGTKIIEAEPMTHGAYAERNGVKLVHQIAEDAGYLVHYEDGYESWIPAEVFEKAYRDFTNLSFGHAIELLKRGYKLARAGWNSNKQYIQLATCISFRTPDGTIINSEHNAIGNQAIAFVGTSGIQMGWLASQADMLAEDWCVFDLM